MRLFTGIELPQDVVTNLEKLLERLQPSAPISWSPPCNLHITTKFIGEWPEPRLAELSAKLAGLPARAPIEISVDQLGFFPNPHAPRIFWAGVQAGEALATLAKETDEALAGLGVPKEKRPYSPHLTLARIKTPGRLTGLLQAVASLPSLEFGVFVTDRFHLYQSRPGPSGSMYTKLAVFPFLK